CSASAVTSRYYRTGAMTNPHSRLARSLYGSGIFGTCMLVMCFVHPVRSFTKRLKKRKQREFMLVMLLLLGVFFGQRSSAPFIYLGMFAAAFSVFEVRVRHARRLQDARAFSRVMTTSSGVRDEIAAVPSTLRP